MWIKAVYIGIVIGIIQTSLFASISDAGRGVVLGGEAYVCYIALVAIYGFDCIYQKVGN